MTVTGDAELIDKIDALKYGIDRDARKAIREGADAFAEELRGETPVWSGEKADPKHMRDDIRATGVRDVDGELEAKVGYGKETGYRVHFPNSGTSRQDPQHFVEETQSKMRGKVVQIFLKHLKVGG